MLAVILINPTDQGSPGPAEDERENTAFVSRAYAARERHLGNVYISFVQLQDHLRKP